MARRTIKPSVLTRRRARLYMPNTAVIQRAALADDGEGGQTETWSAVAGGTVDARIDPLSGSGDRIEIEALKESTLQPYRLSLEWGAPLQDGDRVVINSETYEVLSLDTSHDGGVAVRAVISRSR